MNEESQGVIEPNFDRCLNIWWSWYWRSLVGGLLAGLLAPMLFSTVLTGAALILGGTHGTVIIVRLIFANLVYFCVQVYFLWDILQKPFEDFSIRVVEPGEATQRLAEANFLAPTFGHALGAWWLLFWRSFFISTASSFVLVAPFVTMLRSDLYLTIRILEIVIYGATTLAWTASMLRKNYSTFRLILVPTSTDMSGPDVASGDSWLTKVQPERDG